MCLRILYCIGFITDFFKHNSRTSKGKEKEDRSGHFTFFHVSQCKPSARVCMAFAATFIATSISRFALISADGGLTYSLSQAIAHVAVGAVCFISMLGTMYPYYIICICVLIPCPSSSSSSFFFSFPLSFQLSFFLDKRPNVATLMSAASCLKCAACGPQQERKRHSEHGEVPLR